MSSDSGIRKRNKDKKKKKGSTGDVNIPAQAVFREPQSMKLVIDETIHVPNDRNFGGNWCSKLIFLVFLIAIAGLLFFALSNFNFIRGEKREPLAQEEVDDSESWLAKLVNFNYFASSNEPSVDDGESSPDVQPQPSYLDILWELYPFGGSEEPPQEFSPNEVSDRSEESKDEKYSREIDESKETNAEDEDNDTNQDDDLDNKESEENEDDEEKENDDDDEENDNDNLSTDSDDIPKPFNPYGYRYERDEHDEKNSKEDEEDESRTPEDDENDSPSKSDEEPDLDLLDNRYNYYHSRDQSSEKEKYKYIQDDDDVNDSAEKGAQERFDSGENKEDTPQNEENGPEPDSRSSEEDERDGKPVSKESEEDKEPQVEEKEDHGESGNMITKLSVGTALIFVAYSVIIRKWNNYVNRVAQEAEAVLNNGGDAQNDENADSIAQAVFENVMDLLNDDVNDLEDRLEKNKTLQEYLETPSGSENEQSEDDSVNWQAQGHTPLDLEESETASETGDESENSESETNTSSKYAGNYDRVNITNQYDWRHREEIDDADDDLDHGRITMALEKYEKILKIEPFSVRAKYGMAKCMDKKAEIQKSNQLLGRVIELYVEALQMPDVPLSLAKMIAERVVDRMRFKGDYMNSIDVQKNLVERFPEEMSFHNELAVSYLILNRISDAKIVLENILEKWPDNGLALVNYGFVLKMMGDLERAVEFLSRGIEANESASQDSRFYFHLGDALQKLNRNKEAMKVYEEGAEKGIFLSKYQRSLYNVDRLTAKPWWTIEETKYQDFFRKLISNWKVIRDEALQVLKRERNAAFREESEQLREAGDWRQFEIFSRGVQKPQCKKVPVTCRIVSNFPPAAGCRRGQVKFSLMEPGTHVWPHCGPTNCRLRAHLGLVIPANVSIRVAEEVRSWKEGEILILDDSFEHEVWHNGTSSRLILIVDVWHPELTAQERRTLTAI